MKNLLLVLSLVSALAACAPKQSIESAAPQNDRSIFNGEEVSSDDPDGKQVVAIFYPKAGALCSGTLLSDNMVLTAAHCIIKNTPAVVIFSNRMDTATDDQTRAVINVEAHPGFVNHEKLSLKDLFNSLFSAPPSDKTEKSQEQHDVGLVHFAGGIPEGYHTAVLLKDWDLLKQENAVSLVLGYGIALEVGPDHKPTKPQEAFDAPEKAKAGTQKSVADEEPTAANNFGSGVLRYTAIPIITQTSPSEFMHLQQLSGIASGDSGGPAFLVVNNQLQVWGVANSVGFVQRRDNGKLVGISNHTSIETYIPWIKATTAKMGGTLETIQ